MLAKNRTLLVGDNPFHGVSHLSQERARSRSSAIGQADYAAGLVATSVQSGADGFFFTASSTTLAICRLLAARETGDNIQLHAIVPYAYEMVRSAVRVGGLPQLGKDIVKQIVLSRELKAAASGIFGVIRSDPAALLKAYLVYEVSRIRSAAKASENVNLTSVLLHEVVTDMALALDMEWLFKTHIKVIQGRGITPGFDTRNYPLLVEKLQGWGIDLRGVLVAAPFNSIGFQMAPSREACEATLARDDGPDVIAFSILASGHITLQEAAQYMESLPNLKGIAVGVSKEHHAQDTFRLLRDRLPNAPIAGIEPIFTKNRNCSG